MGMTALKLTRQERARRIELALDAVQAYAKDADERVQAGMLGAAQEAVKHAEKSLLSARELMDDASEDGECAECRLTTALDCPPYCTPRCEKRAHVRSLDREPCEVES